MLDKLEILARKISWLPGMDWLSIYIDSLHARKGIFDQTVDDMKARTGQYKSLVADPFDSGKPSAGGGDAADAGGGGDPSQAAKSTGATSNTDAAGAKQKQPAGDQTSQPTQTSHSNGVDRLPSSGVPPADRSQRAATRASCFMFLFLVAVVGTVWAIFFFDPSHVPWRHSMSFWRIGLQVVLVLIIPIVLYRTIRLWLEGESAKYPDIDFAWQHGLNALQAAGVPLDRVPLFLLVGSEDDHLELALMAASRLDFRAVAVPAGPAALHWYATPTAAYLFTTQVGWLGEITTRPDPADNQAEFSMVAPAPSDAIQYGQPAASSGNAEGTIMADQWQPTSSVSSLGPVSASAGSASAGSTSATSAMSPPSEPAQQGTIMVDAMVSTAAPSTQTDPAELASAAAIAATPVAKRLTSGQSSESIDRLRYVAQLIRGVRGGLCPINGMVVLLPSQIMRANDDDLSEFEKAIGSDLKTISNELRIRCPLSILITGMEGENGFRELVRRVGTQRAVWQRFGRKFDPETENTADEIRGFTTHVVGTFEDWIYTLFRERESLSKPGNLNLYELLCDVRCSMQSRLQRLLTRTCTADQSSLLFSGCYFAATGKTPDQQGFVRGVLDKLSDEQELLQWTDQAMRIDRRTRWISRLGWFVCLTGLAVMFFLVGRQWLQWW